MDLKSILARVAGSNPVNIDAREGKTSVVRGEGALSRARGEEEEAARDDEEAAPLSRRPLV